MILALTRSVSPAMAACELTHLARVPIDPAVAASQHLEYAGALERLGCRVEEVTPAPRSPDSVFVEDTAVVVDELAVMARPGAESRRPEVDGVARALRRYRPLAAITGPGQLDGGDVLRVGRVLYVGQSGRTNDAGIAQLRDHLTPLGYEVHAVRPTGCLHLKTAVTAVSDVALLLNPAWISPALFDGLDVIAVDRGSRSPPTSCVSGAPCSRRRRSPGRATSSSAGASRCTRWTYRSLRRPRGR